MDLAKFWRSFFLKWPSDLDRRGVLVASFGEQVSFVEFLIGEHAVLLERLAPDSVGGRKLILPYEKIEAVKITEPVTNEIFVSCGFRPAAEPTSGRQEPTG